MRPFRLLDLPYVQLKQVILFMNNCQRIKLAICSDKAEEAIRQMNIRNYGVQVVLLELTYFRIATDISEEHLYFHGFSEPVKKEFKAEKIDKKVLSKCYQKESDNEMHLDLNGSEFKFDTADLLQWMVDMFPRTKSGWCIGIRKYGGDYLKHLYSVPQFTLSQLVQLGKGPLDSSQLTEFLDTMIHLERFSVTSTVPINFHHEKALSFKRVQFEDARWIKVEHLMLMKGPFDLTVEKTEFDNEDLCRYLKHWKSTKDNVKGQIELYLKNGVTVDRNAFCQGIPYFRAPNANIILCDNDLEREEPLGVVSFTEGSRKVVFRTWRKEKGPLCRYEKLVLFRRVLQLQNRVTELDSQKEKCKLEDPVRYKELNDERMPLLNEWRVALKELLQDSPRVNGLIINI